MQTTQFPGMLYPFMLPPQCVRVLFSYCPWQNYILLLLIFIDLIKDKQYPIIKLISALCFYYLFPYFYFVLFLNILRKNSTSYLIFLFPWLTKLHILTNENLCKFSYKI